jgi:hypothetical protein
MNVLAGAVFTGNGIIEGNVINAGLVRIPIVDLPQIHGGTVFPNPIPPGGGVNDPNPLPVNPGTGIFFGGGWAGGGGGGGGGFVGGGGNPPPVIRAPDVPVQGTFAVDASLEVTGNYTQTATGDTRLYIGGDTPASINFSNTGGDYSQLFVDKAVTLAGGLQVVLQPELFSQFNYTPHVGDTFDFIMGTGGITLATGFTEQIFVDQAGLSLVSGLNLTLYSSGISGDPDTLYQISNNLFSFTLIDNNTILQGTLIAPLTGGGNFQPIISTVPLPAGIWLFGTALAGFLGLARRKLQ